jgi:uncharacterized membrane protein
LFEKAKRADAALLWSNNLLLFWMSLIPFVTAYLGENCRAPLAVGVYGGVLSLASVGFLLLQIELDRQAPDDAARRTEFRRMKRKAFLSVLCYAASAGLAMVSIHASYAVFVIIPLLYFWPEGNRGQGIGNRE